MARERRARRHVLQKVEQLLEVDLEQDELAERAQRASQLAQRIANAIEARSEAAKAAKLEIDEMTAEQNQCLREYRLGRVEQLVEVELQLNARAREVEYVRLDTGEVYKTRRATESDLQLELMPSARSRGKRAAQAEKGSEGEG